MAAAETATAAGEQCVDTDARAALSPEDRQYRDLLEQLETQASDAFDKTAVTLSGGALAISIAFLKDVAPQPVPWTVLALLAPSWGCLVASLLGVLLSQMASQKSMRYEIECLDGRRTRGENQPAGGWWRRCTDLFNYLALIGCVVGIALLVVFVVINTRSKATMAKSEPQKIVRSEPRTLGRVTPEKPPAPPPSKKGEK